MGIEPGDWNFPEAGGILGDLAPVGRDDGQSICHAIVTAHGGTITVESEVGQGTTFRMELPAAPAAASATDGDPVTAATGERATPPR